MILSTSAASSVGDMSTAALVVVQDGSSDILARLVGLSSGVSERGEDERGGGAAILLRRRMDESEVDKPGNKRCTRLIK